jgi:hypothetical protein
MSYQAGDTYPASVTIRDGAGAVTDPDTLTLSVREPDATVTVLAYGTDTELARDSEGVYHADIPLTAAGMWVFQWETTDEAEVEGVQVWASPAPTSTVTFCTVTDIATRLGRNLTTDEQSTVQMLCDLVTNEMCAAADKDADYPGSLTEIPLPLRSIAIDVVTRVMLNPQGYSSTSETLGAYSYTQRYGSSGDGAGGPTGIALTPAEERRVRRAVFGASVASIEVPSIFDQELPLP